MIGIIKTILGSGDVITKGMELIDDLHTSEEEDRESKTKAKVELMNAYAPFKVAQRWIAIMFTVNFIAMLWGTITLWAMDKDMLGFIEIMQAFNIGWIMFAIITFYFGGGLSESVGRSFIKTPEKKSDK